MESCDLRRLRPSVGCDEIRVRQGHQSVSVFCELMGKRVRFAVPGKDQSARAIFMGDLGWRDGIRGRGRARPTPRAIRRRGDGIRGRGRAQKRKQGPPRIRRAPRLPTALNL